MKKFNRLKKSLALTLIFAVCFVFFAQSSQTVRSEAASISQLQQQINDLKKQQTQNASKLAATQGNISKEKEKQAALNSQIDVTNKLITALNQQIDALNVQISDTQKKLTQKEAEISSGVSDFNQRLRAMYLSGDDSYASILLGSSDFYDMLMRLELSKRVAKHDNDTITNLISLKNEIAATKTDLETQKAAEVLAKEQSTQNLGTLSNLYSQTADSIQNLQKEEKAYKNQSAALKAQEDKIESDLQKLIAQQNANNPTYVGGVFSWPVPGFYTITSGFGPRWGTIHKGIDIAGKNAAGIGIFNQPIVASNSGRVIVATNSYTPGVGYGKYVVIDHGGGYSTLYGHQNNVVVSVGQWVTKGQVIGYAGTTGDSTGYHCHFEVRINGVARDPMGYFSKVN